MANNVFPPRPPFPPAPPRGRSVPPPPPGVMQYIGARYVPIFADPVQWQPNKIYEPLTIVTYNNSSYTSKQTVPTGISPDNGEYWVETGNFNAQLNDLSTKIDGWDEEIAANTQTANEAKATADAAQQAVEDLDLSGLQQSVTDAIQKVDDLEPLVQENTDNIALNTAAIGENKTAIQKNETDIADLKSADTALGNRLTTCENNIATAQSDITQAQTDISQNTTNISANTSAIAGITTGLADANTDIQKNATDIASLQTDVAKNTNDIGTANTTITNLQTQVDNVAGQIQTIKDQSDAATEEVERLTTIVGDDNSGLIKDFNDLKEAVESGESVEALAGRVGLLENQVGKPATDTQEATGLEKKIADNTSSIAANTTAIGDNAASLTALENQVGHQAEGENPATGMVKEIEDIKASIGTVTGDVGDRLDTLDSEVSALKTTVGDSTSGLVKDVDANMGDIAALQADVTEIQGQQTAQDTAISGNTTAIGNAVTRITAVENGKQDKLTVDDSLNFTPPENPSNLAVKLPSVPMTQEEYDALETKEDKLYVITDSDESGGGGSSGVSSFNGRRGAVTPQTGDYSADMVGALSASGGTVNGDIDLTGYSLLDSSNNDCFGRVRQNNAGKLFTGLSEVGRGIANSTPSILAGIATPVNNNEAANKAYVDNSIIRQNFADNSYFANAVNQRNATFFNAPGYSITRWKLNESASLTVDEGYLTLSIKSGTDGNLEQPVDNLTRFTGKQITFSVLASGHFLLVVGVNNGYEGRVELSSNTPEILFTTVQLPENLENLTLFIQTKNISSKLYACKFEIGDSQTLARNENDEWIINEIPDYATELLKCQRYFVRYQFEQWQTIGLSYSSSTQSEISISAPVMRIAHPTITHSNGLIIENSSGVFDATIHDVTIQNGNCILYANGGPEGMGKMYASAEGLSYIDLNAEL